MGSVATFLDEQQEMLAVSNLVNLYAITGKLHGTQGRRLVLETIESIAASLSGSDELAIFEVDPTHTRLLLVSGLHIEAKELMSIPMGIGLIGRAAASGEIYERFFEADASLHAERHLRACIPLKIDNIPLGAIAIFDRNRHSLVHPPLNREWIEVFAIHAASALYWTSVCETATAALE